MKAWGEGQRGRGRAGTKRRRRGERIIERRGREKQVEE